MNRTNDRHSTIRMFNVSKRFGGKPALRNISLDIDQGEFVFITGHSGAGKSTLLKILYLAEKASEGQIIINGMNIARVSSSKLPMLRRRFGIVFQDFKLIPTKTVYDNVALVLEAGGEKPSYIFKKVKQVLRITGMEKKIHALPPTLSGGEQQRVAVARAVVGEPAIIFADEPTGSLDPSSARAVLDLLVKYHNKGTTVLVASHNMHLMESSLNSRNIELSEGRLRQNSVMTPDRINRPL